MGHVPSPKAEQANKTLKTNLFLVLLSALALAGCEEKAAPVGADTRPVLVIPVHYERLVPDRSLVGVIKPSVEADLGFRVAGKIDRRLVDVGHHVTAGQALATLDPLDLKIQTEQAEAELRASVSVLAQAAAAEKRTVELHAKGWTTNAQVEQARATGEEGRARFERAQRALDLARNALSYASLLADADGIVTATNIEPGQVVAAGQSAIRVAHSDEKDVVVSLPETLVERARKNGADNAVKVSLWSAPGKIYTARLRELSPAADPATRTYLAKFALLDGGPDVLLGMTASVILSDTSAKAVTRVPLSALFNQGSGPALYTVDVGSGALTLKPIVVERYETDSVLVASGVEEGESVVTLGVQKLDPHQKVHVVSALSF